MVAHLTRSTGVPFDIIHQIDINERPTSISRIQGTVEELTLKSHADQSKKMPTIMAVSYNVVRMKDVATGNPLPLRHCLQGMEHPLRHRQHLPMPLLAEGFLLLVPFL
jgi:hypothetical protein